MYSDFRAFWITLGSIGLSLQFLDLFVVNESDLNLDFISVVVVKIVDEFLRIVGRDQLRSRKYGFDSHWFQLNLNL